MNAAVSIAANTAPEKTAPKTKPLLLPPTSAGEVDVVIGAVVVDPDIPEGGAPALADGLIGVDDATLVGVNVVVAGAIPVDPEASGDRASELTGGLGDAGPGISVGEVTA